MYSVGMNYCLHSMNTQLQQKCYTDLFQIGILKVGFKMHLSCVPLKPHPVLLVGEIRLLWRSLKKKKLLLNLGKSRKTFQNTNIIVND
jgi:hypothetical protein